MKTDTILWKSPKLEPWPEPADGHALLDELATTLRRFVVVPPHAPEALALWALHTYAFALRDITAYVGLESPEKRCGKTTLLTVLGELVNRPTAAAHISSPAFYRLIDETRPTLLMDEVDTLLRGNNELKGVLNAGCSRKTGYVVRVSQTEQSDESSAAKPDAPVPDAAPPSRLARFSCWCPKLLAVIGHLPDTLADRCIIIRMERKLANEKCERLRHLDAADLRRRCARFVLDHAPEIAAAQPELPPGLHDRAADIWEPLLALADLAGGGWPEKSRRAALHLGENSPGDNPIAALLLDIMKVFKLTRMKQIFSRDLVMSLNRLENSPWNGLVKVTEINEVWLSQQLRPYGIRPRNMWCDGIQARGYSEEDFSEVFQRYVPRLQRETLLDEIEIFTRACEQETAKSEAGTAQSESAKSQNSTDTAPQYGHSTGDSTGKTATNPNEYRR